ncbi:MAG: hypothetical protein ACJ0DL_01740 [Gammaproteobacteria bacterium]
MIISLNKLFLSKLILASSSFSVTTGGTFCVKAIEEKIITSRKK